jgi:hypothetical protein
MLSSELKERFKRDFDVYKNSGSKKENSYEYRKNQIPFAEFAGELIRAIVSSDKTDKEDFNQIILLTKAGDRALYEETGLKKIQELKIDDVIKKTLLEKYTKTYSKKEGRTGFTAYPQSTFVYIKDDGIREVKKLLKEFLSTDSLEQQKNIIKGIGKINGASLSHFAPIFYYLYPERYPILNQPVQEYFNLDKSDMKFDYYADTFIKDLTEIKDLVGEKNFGFIDSFLYDKCYPEEVSKEMTTRLQESEVIDYRAEFERLRDEHRIEVVTFHPALCYEDFIEGIRPESTENGLKYPVRPGIFKELCKRAEDEYDKAMAEGRKPEKFVLIIDEINRGNIPKIFGELITLLEKDKRKGGDNQMCCTLPYSGKKFHVPENLYIIGTMNTADASIALIDVALRRRFSFVELMPDYDALIRNLGFTDWNNIEEETKSGNLKALSIKALKIINQRILEDERLGRDKQIGHSYLWNINNEEEARISWRYDIIPLLQEYLYGRYDEMARILNDGDKLIDSRNQIIRNFSIKELNEGLQKIISTEAI